VLGHGLAGLILRRIGRRGWMGRVGFHVCHINSKLVGEQGLFSAAAPRGERDQARNLGVRRRCGRCHGC
jgi:hypothetical protein